MDGNVLVTQYLCNSCVHLFSYFSFFIKCMQLSIVRNVFSIYTFSIRFEHTNKAHITIKHRGLVVTFASYSVGTGFESRPGNRLYLTEVLHGFLHSLKANARTSEQTQNQD